MDYLPYATARVTNCNLQYSFAAGHECALSRNIG